jgi:hypothetical protein
VSAEATTLHTRLLRCALEIEESRAWWRRAPDDDGGPVARRAFEEYWFGAKSLPRVEVLIHNMRARFDAFPPARAVLHRWPDMDPDTRRVICHWHLQLADPLYRAFTAAYLPERRQTLRPDLTRDRVVAWVEAQDPGRWTAATHIQFASKLLSAAYSAGLVRTNRDPRPLALPRVPDKALAYLLHLLRGTTFAGTLRDNPYLASVGLTDTTLEERLRTLPALRYHRQGDLVDFGWQFATLQEWADATFSDTTTEGAAI